MPADELGHRVHGHISPESQRALVERRREGVVDTENRATFPWRGANDVEITDGE